LATQTVGEMIERFKDILYQVDSHVHKGALSADTIAAVGGLRIRCQHSRSTITTGPRLFSSLPYKTSGIMDAASPCTLEDQYRIS
jgi:hypothetical protein